MLTLSIVASAAPGRHNAWRLDCSVPFLAQGRRLVEEASYPFGVIEHVAHHSAGAAGLLQPQELDVMEAATTIVPVVAARQVLRSRQGILEREVRAVHAQRRPDPVPHQRAQRRLGQRLDHVRRDQEHEVAVAELRPRLRHRGQMPQRSGRLAYRRLGDEGLVVPRKAGAMRKRVFQGEVVLRPLVLWLQHKVAADQVGNGRPPGQVRMRARVDEEGQDGGREGFSGASGVEESRWCHRGRWESCITVALSCIS